MNHTNEFLDQMRQTADPLADETIRLIVAEKGQEQARKLFDLLIRHIELPVGKLPAAARSFIAATNQLPDWADWEKVRLANQLFLDHGPKFLVFLYYRSLPILYSCSNGAKVLVNTGRLAHGDEEHRIFARRIAETGQFLLEVMAPGSLHPGGKGIQAIQKVRLIHAAIRAFIPETKWDADKLGLPINQEDMAITLLTFSIALTDALEKFHVREDTQLKEAYLHTWMAIGHVLGLHPDLLPAGMTEARQLQTHIMQRQSRASEEGKMLTQALLTFARSLLPAEFQKTPELLMFHLNGPELSHKLGLQTTPGCFGQLIPGFLTALFGISERLEDRVDESLQDFIRYFSKVTSHAMVGYFDKYKGRNFEMPEHWLA